MIRRTKARMRLCVLLLCLILMFIWGNSLLPREASEKLSQGVKAMLSGILPSVGSGSEGNGHHILRKVAHFFEFCCLGLCLSWLVRMLRKAPWELYILPLLGGVLVACLDERALADIFYRYGEEKFSRPIARAIVRERDKLPITTTLQLAELISDSVPAAARRDGHPARRVFQALRIAVNKELDCLSAALDTAFDRLVPGGRLAVITFHSLEDAIVKNRFAAWRQGCICPKDCPVCLCGRTPAAQPVLRKPATATPEELADNPRSRSAKLRCVEKLHDRYQD